MSATISKHSAASQLNVLSPLPLPVMTSCRLMPKTWLPLGTTPPFPDYISGHTTYTGAFVHVLERIFGTEPVTFSVINPNVPVDEQVRTYQSVGELGDEMIEARILAGIHFRTADRDGDRVGRQVAQFVLTHVLRDAH